ncbi:hypothetical protein IWQ62_003929 [Dispira parvispora]|uniref:Complex III subunit 9 n=1 Tax=Dispira parvispora TaxID=1520584 RepID=A0A9W8AMX8_9FUNG|nr:hypothetical protein IWQ62_003929 [Dispira parvispora]
MPSKAASGTTLNHFNRVIYNSLFRRNSVFVGGIMFAAFAYQLTLNNVVDNWYEKRNEKGHPSQFSQLGFKDKATILPTGGKVDKPFT